jgi:TolB protein
MQIRFLGIGLATILLFFGLVQFSFISIQQSTDQILLKPAEKHFKNIKQLTFGGDNAEAYWSFNDKLLTFQKTKPSEGIMCDQIYYSNINKFNPTLISTGKGRTTCSFFMPDNKHILFASTHLAADSCPAVPDRKKLKKYIWPIYNTYDIFVADLNGKITKQLTNSKGYDAEGVVSPKGDKIIFTSTRNGDLDLFTMNIDGTNVTQITKTTGYDGGANFSPDGKMIVWRASRPQTPNDKEEYYDLLEQGMVAPTQMEVFVANVDGTNAKQITSLGHANWAPSFHPSGQKVIFASNHEHPKGFPFNLYLINIDGTQLEKISSDDGFDAFPMFSNNGKKIAFSSNRNNNGGYDTNVFIADWIE